jgi:hypothetical protein
VQDSADYGERECTGWQVNIENPPPRKMIDEEPAEQRADDRGNSESGPKYALVAAALTRRDEIANEPAA